MRGGDGRKAWAERNVGPRCRLTESQPTRWDAPEQLLPIRGDLQCLRVSRFLDSQFAQLLDVSHMGKTVILAVRGRP